MTRYTPPKKRVAYVGPELSDSSSTKEKERIARRRVLVSTGRCPCGAELPTVENSVGVVVLTVEHRQGCPAAE